ncbi:hypothetical protein ACEPAI_4512 [Sanghuangporus weigelae]
MSSENEKKDRELDSERGVAPDLPVLDSVIKRELDAHVGVKRVEAAERVWGKYSKWILFISTVSLGLACYIYSLDGQTTSYYLAFAASSFGRHSLISSVQVAQSVIIAVGKPVIAKIADVTSRAYAYLGVLLFYVVGYIIIASAQNINAVAAGIVIYAIGLQLLTQVIVADMTTLRWRSFISGLTSLPFVVNAWIGANIANDILEQSSWRWGYGMFAILVPATLIPLISILFWAERKAKRLGIVDQELAANGVPKEALAFDPAANRTIAERARLAFDQLDIIGLTLLGAAVALILLPLTLANNARRRWENPSMIAMLVVGVVLLFVFAIWDLRFAKRPVVAPRFLRNRSVVLAAWVGFFDFVSFYLTYVYLYSFVLVVKPWSTLNATYFVSTQTVALTVFGILAGAAMLYVRRYKPFLVGGLLIRLLGVGLMIHSRGANASTVEIVWSQILQGMGGGVSAVASQTAAQAGVPHIDVAIVTAVVLLWTEIGGSVGSAIAGAIWSNTMLDNMRSELPDVPEEQLQQLYGSIVSVISFPRGSEIREGVINAYDKTMRDMIIAATAVAVVPIILALFMPNWYLGDKQNAVEDQESSDGETSRQ